MPEWGYTFRKVYTPIPPCRKQEFNELCGHHLLSFTNVELDNRCWFCLCAVVTATSCSNPTAIACLITVLTYKPLVPLAVQLIVKLADGCWPFHQTLFFVWVNNWLEVSSKVSMVRFEEFKVYLLFCDLQCITWAIISALYVQNSEDTLLNLFECVQLCSAETGWPDSYHSSALTADSSMSTCTSFVIYTEPYTEKDIYSAK